jgi:hypothetical protein
MMLALYAGGDLPDREASRLRTHLENCEQCLKELEELQRARAVIKEIDRIDFSSPLPSDFADKILTLVLDRGERRVKTISEDRRAIGKPAAIFGSIITILLISIGLLDLFRDDGLQPVTRWRDIMMGASDVDQPRIDWLTAPYLAGLFDEPVRLDRWTPPGISGVYAIMHRDDPENQPSTYTIDYCGQNRKLISFGGYPWLQHARKRLLTRAGSIDNVFIAVIPMPQSSGAERRELKRALIEIFDPYFNKEKGA